MIIAVFINLELIKLIILNIKIFIQKIIFYTVLK